MTTLEMCLMSRCPLLWTLTADCTIRSQFSVCESCCVSDGVTFQQSVTVCTVLQDTGNSLSLVCRQDMCLCSSVFPAQQQWLMGNLEFSTCSPLIHWFSWCETRRVNSSLTLQFVSFTWPPFSNENQLFHNVHFKPLNKEFVEFFLHSSSLNVSAHVSKRVSPVLLYK